MGLPHRLSFDEIGGRVSDYRPVEDDEVELSAEADNKSRLAVAGMSRLAFCWASITGSSTNPAVVDHDAPWGNSSGVKPTIAVGANTGSYTLTWPATVTTELEESKSISFRSCWAQVRGTTSQASVNLDPSVNTVVVTCFSGTTRNWLSGIQIDLYAQ